MELESEVQEINLIYGSVRKHAIRARFPVN
jgi:hypothetical protein